VCRHTAAPLVDTNFNGGNATVFVEGDTWSGKTFTVGDDLSSAKIDYSHGIYVQTARDIFHRPLYHNIVHQLKSLWHFMESIVAKCLIYCIIKSVYVY
jgi:hypothetical protein